MANNVYFFNITYKTWDKNVPVWLSKLFYQIVVAVQSLSCVRFFVIPWTAPCQAFLSSIISQSLIKFMSIELVILSNHLILCCAHFPFHPQSFPASGSFPVSHLFTSDDQSIGASASASILPVHIQNWFPLRLTGLISLQSKGLSRVLSSTTIQKHQFFSAQPSVWSNFTSRTWLMEKS